MTTTSSTIALEVSGMSCGACERHVSDALRAISGVRAVQMDVQRGSAVVTYDGELEVAQLIAAVDEAGYAASVSAKTAQRRCCCG